MPHIDCLRIELDKLREKGSPEEIVNTTAWQAMKLRLQESPHFEYQEEFEEMYEILYRHLKLYYCAKIYGEEFVFVQMILISKVWDFPAKASELQEDKQHFIDCLDLETEEGCLENDCYYDDAYRLSEYGRRSIEDLYWRRPSSSVVHFKKQLSRNVPVEMSYWLYEDELGWKKISKIEHIARYIQPEFLNCGQSELYEVAPSVAKKLLRTTPLIGEEGERLVSLTYEWLCAQPQFIDKMLHITDELSEYTIDEFLDVFDRLASTYAELDSAYYDYLWRYNSAVRTKINSPEECVQLAHKYALPYTTFDAWASDKDDYIDGIAIFENGTCVVICDGEFSDGETLEERAKCILRERYEDIDLFEYDPVCVDEDNYSENHEQVYGTCSHGGIFLFYWLYEYEGTLDSEIIRSHLKKDYEDLIVQSIITRKTLGN